MAAQRKTYGRPLRGRLHVTISDVYRLGDAFPGAFAAQRSLEQGEFIVDDGTITLLRRM